MKNQKVTFMTQAAMIAAIYVVLTYVFAPFSFGEVQVPYCRGTDHSSVIYSRRNSGAVCRLSDRKYSRRSSFTGYPMRKSGNLDRRFFHVSTS